MGYLPLAAGLCSTSAGAMRVPSAHSTAKWTCLHVRLARCLQEEKYDYFPCRKGPVVLSYDIGKFSLSYIIKSALRSDAHSHERQMSAKADHARRSKSVLLGRKWNCEGVRSTLLL